MNEHPNNPVRSATLGSPPDPATFDTPSGPNNSPVQPAPSPGPNKAGDGRIWRVAVIILLLLLLAAGTIYLQAGFRDSGNTFNTLAGLTNSTAVGAYAQVQGSNSIVLGSVDTATKVGIGTTLPSNTLSVSPLDYALNTVTRTNGSNGLVGSSTIWTAAMVGDIIVFADGTSNTVASFTDATHVTMGTTYAGVTDGTPVNYRFHRPGFQVTSAGNAYVANTNTTAFQVQNSLGMALLVANTTTMTVTVTSLTVATTLTVNGHIVTGGSAPTLAAGTAACTAPTVSLAGTGTAGLITVTTGSACASAGKLATITFATAFTAAPRVTLTPATATAAGVNTYVDSATTATTAFDLDAGVTPASATTYKWYYHVIQ